jgi:hypothetical protein
MKNILIIFLPIISLSAFGQADKFEKTRAAERMQAYLDSFYLAENPMLADTSKRILSKVGDKIFTSFWPKFVNAGDSVVAGGYTTRGRHQKAIDSLAAAASLRSVSNVGSGAGVWKTTTSGDAKLRSILSPTDGGTIVTQGTDEISLTNGGYVIYGKNTNINTAATTTIDLKDFTAITQDGTYIITAEISGWTSAGSYTIIISRSARMNSSTCTLGAAETVVKTGEAIGTFSTPTFSWDAAAGRPIIKVAPGATTNTYWNITYKVSAEIPNL